MGVRMGGGKRKERKSTDQKPKIKLVEEIREILPINESFDITERNLTIGGKEAYLYFTVGFVKDHQLQLVITDFQNISTSDMKNMATAGDFIKEEDPYRRTDGSIHSQDGRDKHTFRKDGPDHRRIQQHYCDGFAQLSAKGDRRAGQGADAAWFQRRIRGNDGD